MPNIVEVLQRVASNFNLEDFELFQPSKDFDIYLLKEDERIEVAILREVSKPHYHAAPATEYFLFLDEDSVLQRGECKPNADPSEVIQLTTTTPVVGEIYEIPQYMGHCAGPWFLSKPIRLLLGNEHGKRDRGKTNAYPNDTHMINNYIVV